MMKPKTRLLLWLVPAVLVYVAGFVLATFYDLPIDQALFSPGNLYGALMEAFGWYPAFLPTLLLAMLWMTRPASAAPPHDGRPPQQGVGWQRVACGVVMVAGFAAIYYASYGYLLKRGLVTGLGDIATWIWLAAGLLLFAVMLVPVLRISHAGRDKLIFFGLSGSALMVINHVFVYIVKFIWQRTRFDDMMAAGSFEAFTPWWQPFGHGGSSFPSGHTANAACIFVLLVLCDLYPAWRRRRGLVAAFCWVFIAAMAFARILVGRHFLSDTLVSSGLMALAFFAMRRTGWYKKALHNTLERAALAPGAEDGL